MAKEQEQQAPIRARRGDVRQITSIILLAAMLLGICSCKTPTTDHRQHTPFSLSIEGQVKNPGVYTVTKGTTIRSAISRAGGVYEYPGVLKPSIATVTFPDGSKQKVTWKQWNEFTLHEGDKVTVERNIF